MNDRFQQLLALAQGGDEDDRKIAISSLWLEFEYDFHKHSETETPNGKTQDHGSTTATS